MAKAGNSTRTKTGKYTETHQCDDDVAFKVAALFGDVLEEWNQSDKIQVVTSDKKGKKVLVLYAKTPTLLAEYKNSLKDLALSVVKEEITTIDDSEKVVIEKYFEGLKDQPFIVKYSYAGKSHIFRMFTKTKNRELLQEKVTTLLKDVLKRSDEGNKDGKTISSKPVRENKTSSLRKTVNQGSCNDSKQHAKNLSAPQIAATDEGLVKDLSYDIDNSSKTKTMKERSSASSTREPVKDRRGKPQMQNSVKSQGKTDGDQHTHVWTLQAPDGNASSESNLTTQTAGKPQGFWNFDELYDFHTFKLHLLKESIVKVKADAVVNAANDSLSNGAGVAYALSKAGGSKFDAECKSVIARERRIPVSQTRVTSSGDMKNCNYVIHAVGPAWGDYRKKSDCLNDLCKTVKNVLHEACKLKISNVAMPPISSGIYGVPKDACAAMYIKGMAEFCEVQKQGMSLKEFIIIDKTDNMLRLIDKFYNHWTQKMRGKSIDAEEVLIMMNIPLEDRTIPPMAAEKKEDQVAKPTQGCPMHLVIRQTKGKDEVTCQFDERLTVHVYTGDLLRTQDVDIIVSAENHTLDGTGILARHILESAGKRYQKEHEKLSHSKGPVLVTSAGVLSFKHVFHAVIQRVPDTTRPPEVYLKNLSSITMQILDRASALKKMKSLAMPLLGAGALKDPNVLMVYCEAVIDGIKTFSEKFTRKRSTFEAVHLVNFNKDTTDAFIRVLKCHAEGRKPRPLPPTPRPPQQTTVYKFKNEKFQPADIWRVIQRKERKMQDIDRFFLKPGNLNVIDEQENQCVVCMDEADDPVILRGCHHKFCRECITDYLTHKPACPICNEVYGDIYGDHPCDGVATVYLDDESLQGFESATTFIISYDFPDGVQTEEHPNPGVAYKGISRQAFLPGTPEGKKVLRLLEKAFKQGLTFTIGTSRTTGREGVITWNDIHHKTRRAGGPDRFGYPDEDYLSRVTEELAAKGIKA